MLEVLFPSHCGACGQLGQILCGECLGNIKTKAHNDVNHTDGVISVLEYNENVKHAIHRWKYSLGFGATGFFAGKMTQNFCLMPHLSLVPVPLHITRKLWRGFNQSSLLSKAIAQNQNLEVKDIIKRTRKGKQQARLNTEERKLNTAGLFAVRPGAVVPQYCVIIDDVCASGATLGEIASVLKTAGAKKVFALVIARPE